MPSIANDQSIRVSEQFSFLFPPLFLLPTIGIKQLLLSNTWTFRAAIHEGMLRLYDEEILVLLFCQGNNVAIKFRLKPFPLFRGLGLFSFDNLAFTLRRQPSWERD